MITYNQILVLLESFADSHEQIQRFLDDSREQLPNLSTEDIEFPILFVEPLGADADENIAPLEVNVFCLDRLRKDRKNQADVKSDTLTILQQDLTVWLEDEQDDIDVDRTYPCVPYNNYTLDYLGGWSMRIRFEMERIEGCEIPIDTITPPAPTECEDAEYTLKDTSGDTLSSGTIASGNSQDITAPDATLTLNSGAFTDVESGSTTDIVLQDQNTAPITPDSVVGTTITVNIQGGGSIGAKVLKTGQTVSYGANDDGALQKGRPDDYFILDTSRDSNPFGNWQRFTSTIGGYRDMAGNYYLADGTPSNLATAFPNEIVLDWTTYDYGEVLGVPLFWWTIPSLINDIWSTIKDNCSALNYGGYATGWRQANRKEIEYWMWYGGSPATYPLTRQPPFNSNVSINVWASTSFNGSFPWRLNQVDGSWSLGTLTQTAYGFPVRDFTDAELGI